MKKRAIGPIGTIGRFLLGPLLIYFGFYSPLENITPSTSISLLPGYWDDLFVGIIVLPMVMVLIQLTWSKIKNQPMKATGSIGFGLNILITIFLSFIPLCTTQCGFILAFHYWWQLPEAMPAVR